MPIPHLAQCLVQRDGMATYAQGYDETRKGLFSLSGPDINFPNRMFTHTHTQLCMGKHTRMHTNRLKWTLGVGQNINMAIFIS